MMSGSASAIDHRDLDFVTPRSLYGLVVPRVHMTRNADARIVGQHALQSLGGFRCSIGDDHLPRMEGIPDTYPTAVMEADPGGPARMS